MRQRRQRTTPTERAADAMATRASDAEAKGERAEAEIYCQRILAEFPDHEEARFIQGKIWAQTGRLSDAIAAFREILAQNPGFDAARLALIGALFLTNEYNEGLNHLQLIARQCVAEEASSAERENESDLVLIPLWESYTDRKGLK
jgi:tetratricopeptide (TPR) repeat protein